MKKIRSSEKGQILVLLVLVLIGLLGFTTLAVDGGMIYADRRYMQSAADAASMAGAGRVGDGVEQLDLNTQNWTCDALAAKISEGYTNSINKAAANDFTIEIVSALGTGGNNNGVKIICNESEQYVDVFVMLTRETATSFVHLFTGEPMKNTVMSITRIEPSSTAGNGNTIVSLSLECGNNIGGVHLGGTTNVDIEDGGIWSNSCTDAHGSFDVQVTDGSINYYCPGPWCPFAPDGGGSITPTPAPVGYYHDLTPPNQIPDFGTSCWSDSYDNLRVNPHEEVTASPGNYRQWDIRGTLHLEPGLYCISDKVTMNSDGTVDGIGNGVTIYFTGSSITLNGGLNTTLSAPNGYDTQNPPPKRGVEDMLLYVKPGIKAIIKINGTSGSTFGGTIYAPDSLITINGNAGADSPSEFYTSIIGYDVNLTGASNINFIYDATRDYGFPAKLQVQK